MRKYRCKKIIVNNNINEIDYDKLAEAIVKAQNVEKEESQPVEKIGFWKAVWQIIINKEAKNGKRTAILLAEIMNVIFNVMSGLSVLFAIVTVIASIQKLTWDMDVWSFMPQLSIVIMSITIMLATALIFRAIANEIGAEKDRNYITTLFFGFTSLVSLIVTLVALFKEVG